MYVPEQFRETDVAMLHAQIRRSRLATLVCAGPDGLQASHIPMLLDAAAGPRGTLLCHVARANPQWRSVSDADVLAIFRDEDAYISPSWYATKRETGKMVPTWNYIAVHASGVARVIEDRDELRALVTRLTNAHEAHRPEPWTIDDAPPDYIDALLGAIVGIEIPIARLEGKWKLNQHHRDADLRGAIEGLRASADPRDRAIADEMEAAAARRRAKGERTQT